MIPAPFEYERVASVEDAIQVLSENADAKIIAEVSKGLGEAMVGIGVTQLAEGERLAVRGW